MLDLVASYQQAIIETLVRQTQKAVHPASRVPSCWLGALPPIASCANLYKSLRVGKSTAGGIPPVRVYCPSPICTTDNAAMIAAAGTPKLRQPAALDLQLNAYADLRLC